MKGFMILLTTTALAMGAAAYAASEDAEVQSKVEYKEDGGYEATRTAEQETPDGTKHTAESNVDVDVKADGRVTRTVTTEAATNPKGILNQKKDTAKTEIEQKPRGGYKEVTTRKHIDADGTDVINKISTDVDVDANGNVVESRKIEKTVNPEGLFNEKTTVSKTKTVNGQLVEATKK